MRVCTHFKIPKQCTYAHLAPDESLWWRRELWPRVRRIFLHMPGGSCLSCCVNELFLQGLFDCVSMGKPDVVSLTAGNISRCGESLTLMMSLLYVDWSCCFSLRDTLSDIFHISVSFHAMCVRCPKSPGCSVFDPTHAGCCSLLQCAFNQIKTWALKWEGGTRTRAPDSRLQSWCAHLWLQYAGVWVLDYKSQDSAAKATQANQSNAAASTRGNVIGVAHGITAISHAYYIL